MPFFVYIIRSSKLNRYYTGTSDNVSFRLDEHNSKHYSNAYTAKGIPWTLFLEIECDSSEQAYKLERFIKKMKSPAFIRKLKEQSHIIKDLLRKL